MKIVSWNVAGFRAVLKKGFQNFFEEINSDIFCIQEIKAYEEQIVFEPPKYYKYVNSAIKPGYSGTMVYSKIEPISIAYGMDKFLDDKEGRLITLEYNKFFLVNVYVPNVKRDLSRLNYRMEWEIYFLNYIKNLELIKPVIICGDFNVAHTENDIKNAKSNIGNAGFTYEERNKFTELLNYGLVDTYRYLNPDKTDAYTWWSYMKNVRERNIGWRIDYFLISKELKNNLKEAVIFKDAYGSDHCPIGIDIEI